MALRTHTMSARNQHRQWMLKPQDLAVAFKLALLRGVRLSYQELVGQMHLLPFEAHAAVQRLLAALGHRFNRDWPCTAGIRRFCLFWRSLRLSCHAH